MFSVKGSINSHFSYTIVFIGLFLLAFYFYQKFSYQYKLNKYKEIVFDDTYYRISDKPKGYFVKGCSEVLGDWAWSVGGIVTLLKNGNVYWKDSKAEPKSLTNGDWECIDNKNLKIIIKWDKNLTDTFNFKYLGNKVPIIEKVPANNKDGLRGIKSIPAHEELLLGSSSVGIKINGYRKVDRYVKSLTYEL